MGYWCVIGHGANFTLLYSLKDSKHTKDVCWKNADHKFLETSVTILQKDSQSDTFRPKMNSIWHLSSDIRYFASLHTRSSDNSQSHRLENSSLFLGG
jgi:hypothetical protein